MAADEGCDSRRPSVSATEGRAPSREQTIPSRGAPPGVCLTHTTRGRGVLCILLAHGPRVDGSVILTGTEMKNHVLALKIPAPPPRVTHRFCLYFTVHVKPRGHTPRQRVQGSIVPGRRPRLAAWRGLRRPSVMVSTQSPSPPASPCGNRWRAVLPLFPLRLLLAGSLAGYLLHLKTSLSDQSISGQSQPIVCVCR